MFGLEWPEWYVPSVPPGCQIVPPSRVCNKIFVIQLMFLFFYHLCWSHLWTVWSFNKWEVVHILRWILDGGHSGLQNGSWFIPSYAPSPLFIYHMIFVTTRLLHMIWYSGAHWSMATCKVSLFFTSLHTPTFKLLKLDLRTWIQSSTSSLSFRGKPFMYWSNEWAWTAVA